MKLIEVLQKISPKIKTSTKSAHDFMIQRQHQLVGGGAQALAYLHKKFPNRIIKTIQISYASDPSYQFLRLALNHQDNPYFPKIYSVKQYTMKRMSDTDRDFQFALVDVTDDFSPPPDQREQVLYIVMEKLTPVTITADDLEYYGLTQIAPSLLPLHLIKRGLPPEQQVKMAFRRAFTEASIRKRMYQHVSDPKLKQALRLLEPLFRHYAPDMHPGNIMKRADGHWVFIDPITPY